MGQAHENACSNDVRCATGTLASFVAEAGSQGWLCAGAMRMEGSDDDAYEIFAALHAAGRLLPDGDDELRDRAERNARILEGAAEMMRDAIADGL